MARLCLLACTLCLAPLGCGSEDGNAPVHSVIDARDGSYRGVGIDDDAGAMIDSFGPVTKRWTGGFIQPRLGNNAHPASYSNCKAPPPGQRWRAHIYDKVSFFSDNGTICGWLLVREGAATAEGVAIGGPLREATDAYPELTCGRASIGEGLIPVTFPYCTGRLAHRRYIWFAGDPIDTIQMMSERLHG